MNEPLLKDALSYEKVFTNNDDMYRKYQQREDAIRDEQTKIAMGEQRGIAIGEQRGIAIGEQRQKQRDKQRRIADTKALAKKMLNNGMDINDIVEYTNLSMAEIESLKQ